MLSRRWLAALLLVSGTTLPASAQTKFEWKLNKGDKFKQTTVTVVDQKLTINKQTSNQKMEQTVVTQFTVLDRTTDGNVILEQKIEDATAKSDSGGNPGATVAALKGVIFKITLNPKMEVIKFEGYEEAMKQIAGMDPVAAKTLRGVLTEETLRKAAEEAFNFLPADPKKVGDTWKNTATVPLGQLGTIQADNEFKYAEQKNNLDIFTVTTAFKYTPPKGDVAGGVFEIQKGDLKAESAKGTIQWDNRLGRLVGSVTDIKMSGSLTIKAMGAVQTMEMEQTQKITVSVSQ